MTAQGALNRAGILLLLITLAAAFSWSFPYADMAALGTKLAIFSVVALVLALATMFRPDWSPHTAPAYAIAEGLVLGSLSRLVELTYSGIVFQAVALTLAVSFSMWALYRFRLIQVTDRFRTILTAATLGIFLVYLVSGLMTLFGGSGLGLVQGATPMGILFSLIVVAVAALNLLLNFDFIDRVSSFGAPKFMEWYAAFGLAVTLVWLYIEILHLLTKLRRD
jgi:uncharacterized YccA/Bax inhibitor family protein